MKEGEVSPSLPSPQSLARLRLARSFRSCPLPPLRGHKDRGNALKLCRKSPRLHRSPAPATPPAGLRGRLSKPPAAPHPCPQRLSTTQSQHIPAPLSWASQATHNTAFLQNTTAAPKNPHIFQFFFQICDKNRISIQLYI